MNHVRTIAHVVWLEWPYIGRCCYFVERDGRVGFVAATQPDDLGGAFIPADDPDLLSKVLRVVRPETPTAEARAAERIAAQATQRATQRVRRRRSPKFLRQRRRNRRKSRR